MRKILQFALLLLSIPVFGQNVRWDSSATTTTGVGQLVPVLAIPGAQIAFYSCTGLSCGTPAVTYPTQTSATPCPAGAPVVWQPPISQGCVGTADSQGNFGGWFQPGLYQYTVTVGNVTSGPYFFSVGGSSGGGGSGGQVLFNVQSAPYNAKCDGVTIDDAALAAAEAAALAANGTVYIQPGVTCKVSQTWQVRTSMLATGATLATSSDIVVLEVGSPTIYTGPPVTPNLVLWLPDTLNLAKPAFGWNGTVNTGVKIENVNSTEIHEGHNKGFLTGTWVASINGLGTAYDKIFIGEEENNFIDYKLLPEDNSGYINQNTFVGGRLEMDGGSGAQPHVNVTGVFTAGSAIVTSVSPNTTGITAGMTVIVSPKIQPNVSTPQPSVPYATTVASVNSSSQITLNHPSNITTDTLLQAPVTAVSLPSPNTGYSGSCSVTIGPPQTTGGTTATATCSVSGGAISVTLTNGGTLYQAPPVATFVVTGAPTNPCSPNICTSTTIGTQFIEQPNTIIFPWQGSRQLLISHQSAGYTANGNTFIGQSWEGDAAEYQVELAGATDNTFVEGRFESSAPRLKFTSAAGYTTEYNHFDGGYGGLYLTQVMDDQFTGANDLQAPGYQYKQSGGGQRGAVMYSSQSSVQDPLIVFMGPGNGSTVTQYNQSVLPCPATGATSGQCPWYLQVSPEYLQAKQAADIWPRYRFSTSNGSLSFGDGTFDLSGQNGNPIPNTLGYIAGSSGKDLGVSGSWWIANDGWNAGHFVFYDNAIGERSMWLDASNHYRVIAGAPTSDTSGMPVNADLYTVTLNSTPSGFNAGDTYTATNAVQGYGVDSWSQPNTAAASLLTVFDPVVGIKCFSAAAATTPGAFASFWTLQTSCPISGSGGGVTSINGTGGAFTFSFSTGAGSCSGTTCTFTGSSSGGGSVTNFIASTGSWPTWLVPSVATSTTTPTLSVSASAIPNSALANNSITLGSQAMTLGSSYTAINAVSVINGTVYSTQFTGATLAEKWNACAAAAQALTSGSITGVCDASEDTGTYTTDTQINIGSSAGTAVGFKLPCKATVKGGMTDGTSAVLNVYSGASVWNDCSASALNGAMTFTATSSSNLGYIVETTTSSSGPYIALSGFNVTNITGGHVTATGIAFYLNGPQNDGSKISFVNVYDSLDTYAVKAYNISAGFMWQNSSINCSNVCTPFWASTDSGGYVQSLTLSNMTIVHAGAGLPEILCTDTRSVTPHISDLQLDHIYTETGTDGVTPQINVQGCNTVGVDHYIIKSQAANSTAGAVTISNAYNSNVSLNDITFSQGSRTFTYPVKAVINNFTGETASIYTDSLGRLDHYSTITVPSKFGTTTVNSLIDTGIATAPSSAVICASGTGGALSNTGCAGTTTICSGTITLGVTAIPSGSSATPVTATCTGLLSTDNIMVDFNSNPLGVVGYQPSTAGMLTIVKWPTANTLNVQVVNNTASSVTPGAITLNYRAVR